MRDVHSGSGSATSVRSVGGGGGSLWEALYIRRVGDCAVYPTRDKNQRRACPGLGATVPRLCVTTDLRPLQRDGKVRVVA